MYNLLFGMNPLADLLLAVIGLKRNDIERFRDVHKSDDGATIYVRTRTGGGNRDDYPNEVMRARPEFAGSEDDDYDNTYALDTFNVPEQWRQDVANLGDLLKGFRAEFAQHLALTIDRPPTESDRAAAAYADETAKLKRHPHALANGHTFVPYSDAGMQAALELAEANGGRLRSGLGVGIMPLVLTVKRDFKPWPGARDPNEAASLVRIELGTEWRIDEVYWAHCVERFAARFPLTMAAVGAAVAEYRAKGESSGATTFHI